MLSLYLTCGFLADAVNTHGNEMPSRGAEVCVRSEQQAFRQELVSINKSGSCVLVFLQPTVPLSPHPPLPPHKHTHTHTSLQPPHILKGHFYLKTPPNELTSLCRKEKKNGLLLMIFDCAVRRVLLVKMLIFPPNRQT